MSLLEISYFTEKRRHTTLGYPVMECGTDEAGAGALMGPVVAAAVIWPLIIDDDDKEQLEYSLLKDSKKLSAIQRNKVKCFIQDVALDYSVAFIDCKTIDKINILNARFQAMKTAIEGLTIKPEFLLVDGDKFPAKLVDIEHTTVIGGDNKYQSIAAASILAKCARDDYVDELAKSFPEYKWDSNKGYGTVAHYEAIDKHGITELHRLSFNLSIKSKRKNDCLIDE